jgi:hypothetical protein
MCSNDLAFTFIRFLFFSLFQAAGQEKLGIYIKSVVKNGSADAVSTNRMFNYLFGFELSYRGSLQSILGYFEHAGHVNRNKSVRIFEHILGFSSHRIGYLISSTRLIVVFYKSREIIAFMRFLRVCAIQSDTSQY